MTGLLMHVAGPPLTSEWYKIKRPSNVTVPFITDPVGITFLLIIKASGLLCNPLAIPVSFNGAPQCHYADY